MDNTSTALKAIQDKLLRHFNSLAAVRRRSGFPIFALEHCLDSAELKRINTLLREHQKTKPPLTISYWLVWVVYSSEAGYRYTGDEYWPSFENQTPNWQYHDRVKIKSWFKKFQRSFNGVTPSGPWAEHFSIIAWPITNALLPIDLQRQFARLLYDLRFRLATASLDAGSVGRLLAAHASHASSRFQAFLEQEELTGQIVAAFLRGESADAEDLIYPPTLNRIITDLERVRSSRVWLKETRRVVSDRFQGIGRGYFRPAYMLHSTRKEKPTLPDALRFAVRPNLFLRYDGSNKWSLLLQLKSLRPIAAESTELRRFLDRTRCRLNGSSDWKPTGWLLSGNRKGMLNSWPDTNSPLIQFEQSNPLMDHLLESEFRLSLGPIWLFRIGSDGIARYVESKSIRPATCYIVVTADNFPNEQTELAPCTLACSGIHAFRLSVPNHVSSDTTARFLKVGLDVARTIRVWPVGLPGRGWDGEGSSEWLSTESPCFGIDPDHQVDKLSFRLDDEPECVVATEALGGPTFVRLPPLQAGSHLLTVEALRSPDLNSTVTTPPAKGFLKLEVRDPEPWTPGITSHPGLVVTVDPFDASLDVLWRNELNLSVNGPEAYTVRVNAKLYNSDGSEILSDVVATSMALPIIPEKWHQVFAKFLTNENRAWKYLEAVSCVLEINGDSLGTCLLKFDHEPAPLRWIPGSQRRKTLIHLVDDSGQHDTAPEVQFYSMESPLIGTSLDFNSVRSKIQVPPPGGLYLACHAPYEDAAIVSAPPEKPIQAKLKALGVKPTIQVQPGSLAIRKALRLLGIWHNARQVGFLVNVRQQQVVRSITDGIFRSMCGENWARAEKRFEERPLLRDSLENLKNLVDKQTDFGHRLSRLGDSRESEEAIVARFAKEVSWQGSSLDRELCRFALRLATSQFKVLADPHFDTRVGQLVDNPALFRGARLVCLLREHDSDSPPITQQPVPRK